ncbi:MAG: hypothetical protein U5M23_15080 [Marinagarivorans sp.]|nr:hypothetical protein [Marinagarivorans sp.]
MLLTAWLLVQWSFLISDFGEDDARFWQFKGTHGYALMTQGAVMRGVQ